MNTNGTGSDDPTIRQLVASVAADTQRLAQAQAELVKTEMKATSGEVAQTGGMFIGAAAAGAMGGIFLLVTIAYVLVALGLPTWAGFGIVTLLLLIVAGILAMVGRKRAQNISGFGAAKVEWQKTKQMLSGKQPDALTGPATGTALAPATADSRSIAQ